VNEQDMLWKWYLFCKWFDIRKQIFFTYEEFMNHYNIRLNFIEYFSILTAIPHTWKLLIRGIWRDPTPCKYFYKQYRLKVKMPPLNILGNMSKGSSYRNCYWRLEFHLLYNFFLLQKILNSRIFNNKLYIES
jgi:hypothetical protein